MTTIDGHRCTPERTGVWVNGVCSLCGAENGEAQVFPPQVGVIRPRRVCMQGTWGKTGCSNKSLRKPSTMMPGKDFDSFYCADHQYLLLRGRSEATGGNPALLASG